MLQLNISSIPGFTDVPDANLAAHEFVTDDALVKISQNAKFGAVRSERIFMGYYQNGDKVNPPVSPVDGYPYDISELQFDYILYSTRAPANGFVSGQGAPPVLAASQPANLYWPRANVDDATGAVSIQVSYYKPGGAETISTDGVLKVYANAVRASVNVQT
jgi:hypothetical protein